MAAKSALPQVRSVKAEPIIGHPSLTGLCGPMSLVCTPEFKNGVLVALHFDKVQYMVVPWNGEAGALSRRIDGAGVDWPEIEDASLGADDLDAMKARADVDAA